MGCQKEIARTIVSQGADYVLTLKDNHATLHGEIKLLFDALSTTGLTDVTVDRHESVDMEVGDEVSFERRYFLTSLGCDAERFTQAVRQHWGIENSLHWVLDVSFREDDCRIRQNNGAQNMALLRHVALNLIRQESSHKRGTKARRKRAGRDRHYLLQVLTG